MELSRGLTVPHACRKTGVIEPTYYRWRREYRGAGRDQIRRLKELECENARLKRIVADQALDLAMAKDVIEGKA